MITNLFNKINSGRKTTTRRILIGRPIKGKWFTKRSGSTSGDMQLTTENGDFPIKFQKGTGKYIVDDPAISPNHVTLVDDATPTGVEAYLTHNGKSVRKITQYQMYYFDGTFGMWNDGSGTATGTFVPPFITEGGLQAVLGAVGNSAGVIDSIVITDGGLGYVGGETVTITGGAASGPFDITVATVDGSGAITGFTFTDGGTGANGSEAATVSAP